MQNKIDHIYFDLLARGVSKWMLALGFMLIVALLGLIFAWALLETRVEILVVIFFGGVAAMIFIAVYDALPDDPRKAKDKERD